MSAMCFLAKNCNWQLKIQQKAAEGDKEGLGHQFFHQKLAFDMVYSTEQCRSSEDQFSPCFAK